MDVVGGACRTEYPFSRAPDLGVSTGAYLLGLFPPELLQVALVRLVLHVHLVATTSRHTYTGVPACHTYRYADSGFTAAAYPERPALLPADHRRAVHHVWFRLGDHEAAIQAVLLGPRLVRAHFPAVLVGAALGARPATANAHIILTSDHPMLGVKLFDAMKNAKSGDN